MLSLAAFATTAYTVPTIYPRSQPKAVVAPMAGQQHGLFCEDEYNPATGHAEAVCVVPPYAAGLADMKAGRATLLGDYPAPGAGTRWACSKRYGANAEEEWVNGALQWVHYVR
mmetsp:Transcript_3831/g.11342  ORF Transcript_3831/g.11342 Transcript_3831/m.11342 type:complete len:113 (-) Transcript_3831:268-606(-)